MRSETKVLVVPAISAPFKKLRVAVFGADEERAVGFLTSLLKRDEIEVCQLFVREAISPGGMRAILYKSMLVDKGEVSLDGRDVVVLKRKVPLGSEINIDGTSFQLLLDEFSGCREVVSILGCQKMKVTLFSNPFEAADNLLPGVDVVLFAAEEMLKDSSDEEKRAWNQDLVASFLRAGIKHVILSFPSSLADFTLIPGVNHHLFDPLRHKIISLGDSFSNCVITVATILESDLGKGSISGALVTGVQSRSPYQQLGEKGQDPMQEGVLDNSILIHDDPAKNIFKHFFPSAGESVSVFSVRAPVEKGSVLTMTFHINIRGLTREWLKSIFQSVALSDRWKGIVVCDDEHGGSRVYQKSTAAAVIFSNQITVWPAIPGTDITPVIVLAACSDMPGFGSQIKRALQAIGKCL